MTISIIWTSNRLGGLDVLFNSIAQQETFDMSRLQVILVDEWHAERQAAVAARWEDLERQPGHVIHIPPDEPHDYIDDTHGYNTGLKRADGELIMFLTDGIWLEPHNLYMHQTGYLVYSGYSMTGLLDRYAFPPLKKEDDDFSWSAFRKEFTPKFADQWFAMNAPYYRERKGLDIKEMQELPGDRFYAALNESIPMAVLRDIGGWDEKYSGGYSVNDIDLGTRANLAGWKFLVNPHSINKKLGGHGVSDVIPTKKKKQLRTPEENYAMYQREMGRIANGERTYRAIEGAW